jgi:hypothetical protein
MLEVVEVGKEVYHSEEWLKIFSQEDEIEKITARELAAEEAEEQANKMTTPWEMELDMLEDSLNNPEPVSY